MPPLCPPLRYVLKSLSMNIRIYICNVLDSKLYNLCISGDGTRLPNLILPIIVFYQTIESCFSPCRHGPVTTTSLPGLKSPSTRSASHRCLLMLSTWHRPKTRSGQPTSSLETRTVSSFTSASGIENNFINLHRGNLCRSRSSFYKFLPCHYKTVLCELCYSFYRAHITRKDNQYV